MKFDVQYSPRQSVLPRAPGSVPSLLCAAALLACGAANAAADTSTGQTYKCPGNVYSNTMTAKEAKDKNCAVLEGGSVTVIQGTRPRAAAANNPGGSSPNGSKVDPMEQRARDADARQILERELKNSTDQLNALKAEYNNGEPERRGDEKNYVKYQERVADLKAQVARKESDVAAIKRELSKLPTP